MLTRIILLVESGEDEPPPEHWNWFELCDMPDQEAVKVVDWSRPYTPMGNE